MAARANQLRAVLIPVGVALISIGALAWYGMSWIPAKQRYLDERNARLLRTIGARIKVKVNNFDQAIDHALESFDPRSRGVSKNFREYVKLFAPDLEIVDSGEVDLGLKFGDPPRVKVVLDEGKHYLYLGYSHGVESKSGALEKKRVIARADIEASVGTFLSSHPEFDAIALLDDKGRPIVQQSTAGVEMVNLDTTGTLATKRPRQDSAGGIENVRIGGADYRFYVQPVQLSLLRDTTDVPEEWRLCGLVRADHFRSASAEISSTYWLLLLAALTALLLAIPIVKLHVVHPRERYHGVDGVATAVSSFLLAGLLTFALLDAFYFGYRSNRETDARLSALADDLNTSLANEVNAAANELDVQVKALETKLRRERKLRHTTVSDTSRRRILLSDRGTLDCGYAQVCRTDMLLDASATGQDRYPYYRVITWSDYRGWQRYKWTTARTVTPFINVSALSYVDDARRARRLAYDTTVAQGGVSVIRSPNTGEALTVIWRALPPTEPESLRIATLVTTPISVTRPVLTWGVHFAVVDPTGQVLYHSDTTRSLNENLFQEAMDNGAFRAAVAGRKKESLSAEYFGRPYRMYMQPIDVRPGHTLGDPRWTLIVFEQRLIPETVNLEALTLAVLLFAAYSLLLAIGWGVAHWAWPRGTDKWFWPDARRTVAYMGVTAVNAGLGLTFLFMARRSPPVLLGITLVISLIAIVATFCIVRYSKHEDKAPPRARFHWFLMARVSFLFVVGVVPAMAAFQVAEDYENGLLAGRRSKYATSELEARTERIVRQQRSLRLCRVGAGCPQATAFLQERLKPLAYEVPVRDTAITDSPSAAMNGLRSTLAFWHHAYNNVAVELRAASPGDPSGIFQGDVVYRVLAALLALLVMFVVRKLVWPLYALDLYRPLGFATSLGHKLSGNVLLVGPAGSGKTDTLLRRAPATRVFDVGTLGFVEVGPGAWALGCSAPRVTRVEPAPAAGAAWVDALNACAIPEDGVLAIDHLDYRVDDAQFRDLLLPVLENFIQSRHYNVWIASSKDPGELLNVDSPVADPDRWDRLFANFRKLRVNAAGVDQDGVPEENSQITEAWKALLEARKGATPDTLSESQKILRDESAGWPRLNHLAAQLTRGLTTEPPPSREDVLFEFGVAAESYYRALFTACSMDQKLALYQLAETGVVNPRNHTVIAQLLRKDLVRREPTFRVMNETFRRFIAREMSHETASEWEHEGVRLPWGSISTMMLTMALLPLGLLLLTQQQLLGVWAGLLPTLTPVVPSVVKLISAAPFGGKRGAVPA